MNLMHYLLEANLYLVAFYLLYIALLRSETLYQLNRAYLLITTLIAFILPVLQLGILKPKPVPLLPVMSATTAVTTVEPMVSALPPTTVEPMVSTATTPPLTLADYVLIAYATIALVLFALLVFKIGRLVMLSKKGRSSKQNGIKVIEIPGTNVAFSFFGYLFVNTELLSSPTILRHEEVHIRQKHSWDVIYFELIKIINWFNPVVYLLQKSLKEVHEFIADHEVATAENGAADYADLLISNAYGLWPNQLTNSFFNKNLLKRRIIMLYQRPSGKAARLKYLITLPLMAGLLCASTMAFTDKNYGFIDLDPAKQVQQLTDHYAKSIGHNDTKDAYDNFSSGLEDSVAERIPSDQTSTAPANKADATPSFPGGDNAFHDFLKANIDHNITGTDGTVENNVMMVFTVAKDGSLYDINVHRAGADEFSDQTYDELKRVIKLSPKWIPATQNGQTVNAKRFVIFNSDKNLSFGRKEYIKGWEKAGLSDDAVQQLHMSPMPVNTTGQVLPAIADSIFNRVEVLPQFPGGLTGFAKFLKDNIHYPAADKEAKIQGRVFVQFVVEKDGSLSGLKVVRTPSETLAAEALRVMATSPKWTAGMNKGVAVRTMLTVPINFSLNNDTGSPISERVQKVIGIQAPIRVDDGELVYNAVEILPTFPGGEVGFAKFLRDNIRYPKEAHDAGVKGRVFIQFVVEVDGSLSNMVVLRDPGKGLGDEALRVLKLSPKWKPGLMNGKPVRVQFTVPINFSLSDPDRDRLSTALGEQITKFVRYPAAAKENNIAGREFVAFGVNADKQPTDIKILRSIDQSIDDEVIRALQKCKLDDAKPGTTYVVPLNFYINYKGTKPDVKPDAHPGAVSKLNGAASVNLNEIVITTYK